MKIRSVRCMLMAQDMDRAVAFWRDVAGLADTEGNTFALSQVAR